MEGSILQGKTSSKGNKGDYRAGRFTRDGMLEEKDCSLRGRDICKGFIVWIKHEDKRRLWILLVL